MKGILKYGWRGLILNVYSNNRKLDEITLSKDPKRIFEFLGYDFEIFKNGFNNIEEIFEFVINGKYFNGTVFLMENLNHIDRKRNQKRSSYQQFISYINDNKITKKNKLNDKKNNLKYINDFFPESKLIEKLNQLEIKDKQNQILSTKFNGKIVMQQYPNLKDKMLGAIITQFKNSIENWEEKFINMEVDEIMVEFDNYMCKNIKL